MTGSETELTLDLGTETVHCTTDELAAVLAGALREMRAAAPFVSPHERQILRWIMQHESGSLTVGDVFPDFNRNSDALTALRRLRTAQFIRPADRDHWEAGRHIEVKPLASLLWDRLGEAALFGDAPEDEEHPNEGHAAGDNERTLPAETDVTAPARATPDVSEDIDLSLPEVNDTDGVPTTPLPQKAGWDEADVLEFLNDDAPPTLKSQAS